MSIHPNAEKQAENNAELDKKNILSIESAMVNIGTLVTYICSSAIKRTLAVAGCAVKTVTRKLIPFGKKAAEVFAEKIMNFKRSFVGFTESIAASCKKFSGRVSEEGLGKALVLQLSDIGTAIKNNKNFAKTVINHVVPVASIALLIGVVAEKTSADYGVSIEYNGQEIGVVSEEAVLNEAQQVVADRVTYFDTESETYITATLSLKPLGAQDEVIDEQMLADAIQEQIDTQIVEAEVPVEVEVQGEPVDVAENTNEERAYIVTIDGEFAGAVSEYTAIENFLETKKAEYADEGVIDISFDKNIEYAYEDYVMPDQIVDETEIIEKLDSLVTEPVYYEVVKGDNPWDVAMDNDMTMDELNECFASYKGEEIEDITEYFPIGAVIQLSEEVPYLQVMTTKEVEYTESIDYEIVKTDDPDIYKGDYEVDVEGVEGVKKVVAKVTYKGDTAVATDVISEEVVSEPVTEYRRVGTRETITPVSEGSGGSGVYFWPVDGGYISAYMGDGRGHKGIDIAAPYGTPIYATESGTITQAESGWNGGYGTCVKIKHDNGEVAMYAHMSSLAEISYGDYVVKGQLIGYVGSTGDSTGNHLHFEIRSPYGSYEDPLDYVSQY
ncbi:MAG: peptidoglycan DD-metalloendopeptidase family protein [Oscillospiraceae bacterium]|nr:peptidoglycan DD-metalloendopeptidase family protein [Oscillospiraceae bacterium]